MKFIFLSREELEEVKQKEQNRLPDDVTIVCVPMVKNIE